MQEYTHKYALIELKVVSIPDIDWSENPMATPVYGINILTGERLDFDCIESADRFLGVKYPRYIGLCCRGKWKSYKGYYWHYV